MTNLNKGNFENGLNATIADTGIKKNYINSAQLNIKPTILTTDQPTSTIISYHNNSQLVPLNN